MRRRVRDRLGLVVEAARGRAVPLGRHRQAVVQGYRAGQETRQIRGWSPMGLGPNGLADVSLDLARRRIRDLVDNNPHIQGAQRIVRNNTVGRGIHPMPDTEWPDLNEHLESLWQRDCEGVDVARRQSIADSQGQFLDEVFTVGECLVHFVTTDAYCGCGRGPAIELIDAERIPMQSPLGVRSGRSRHGVEVDEFGRPVAYEVMLDHPNDGGMFAASQQTRRMPAENADLAFIPRRIGQLRGVPWPVSTVEAASLEESYNEAYLMLARVAACLGVIIEGSPADVQALSQQTQLTDANGQPVFEMEPGLIGYLPKGSKVHLNAPSVPPPTFESTTAVILRRMSAGIGISYSALSRDYAKATFSATRAEQLEDRKTYRPLAGFVWRRHTRPYYQRKVAFWVANGDLVLTADQRAAWLREPHRIYKAAALYPGWEWVDPQKEANAAVIAMNGGISTLQLETAARGQHWRDIIRQRLESEDFERRERARRGLPDRASTATSTSKPAEDDADDDDVEEKEAA